MTDLALNTKEYFQAPGNYFWRWSEGTEVVEWTHGETICYRDELIQLLKKCPADKFPSISVILLILVGCKRGFGLNDVKVLMDNTRATSGIGLLNMRHLMDFLNRIRELPAELRTGDARAHLIYEIAKHCPEYMAGHLVRSATEEFNSGRQDHLIRKEAPAILHAQCVEDVNCLLVSGEKLPSTKTLERRLRTGLIRLPEGLDLELLPQPKDLFTEIANDSKTSGIGRIAHKLIPVFTIPRHTLIADNQFYDGVSDITNKGELSNLLLSELAQDDLMLMARLANSEALYLRREQVSETPEKLHAVLIDTSIKMWGVPKVLAVSSALAFIHNLKGRGQTSGYALKGHEYLEIDLSSKRGVMNAIEQSHHALHSGPALTAAIEQISSSSDSENILITAEDIFQSADFIKYFQEVRENITYLVTVRRDGTIEFFSLRGAGKHFINSAHLDIEELLAEKGAASPIQLEDSVKLLVLKQHEEAGIKPLPAFFEQDSTPLLLPETPLLRSFFTKDAGGFIINSNRQVSLKSSEKKAMKELIRRLEVGQVMFFQINEEYFISTFGESRGQFKLYQIDLFNAVIHCHDLWGLVEQPQAVYYFDKYLIVKNNKVYNWVNPQTRQIERKDDKMPDQAYIYKKPEGTPITIRSYSTFHRIREVFINSDGNIVFAHHVLEHVILPEYNFNQVLLSHRKSDNTNTLEAIMSEERHTLSSNRHISLRVFEWKDGSRAIIDSRGYAHLRSSDAALPEITIVLVLAIETTCWASDGTYTGNDYFIENEDIRFVERDIFFEQYIQPFIATIRSHVSEIAT